jgi:hypothetical protein
LFGFDLFS